MLRSIRFPIPVYVNRQWFLFRRDHELAVLLMAVTDGLGPEHRAALRVALLEERPKGSARRAAVVECYSASLRIRANGRLRARCFVVRHKGLLCIEMIEILDAPISDPSDWIAERVDVRRILHSRAPPRLH